MDLLKYEFLNSPEGSYNYNLGQLVGKIRFYRRNVTIDEFKAAIPELKSMERWLQSFDSEINREERFYIEEIMNELDQEDEVKTELINEIEYAAKVIVLKLYDSDFSIEDFRYEFRNEESIFWIEFFGYRDQVEQDQILIAVKEVFRFCSYKKGVVFIDSSC